MIIKCKANDLSRAFNLAASIAPSGGSSTIFSQALIVAADGWISVHATDGERFVQSMIKGENDEPQNEICLPIAATGGLLSRLGNADITLDCDMATSRCTLKCEGKKYTLGGIKADEFPPTPNTTPKAEVTLDAATLLTMLRKTTFAVETAKADAARTALVGVCFEVKSGNINSKLHLTATNTHRLSHIAAPVARKFAGDDIQSIIEPHALAPIQKALDGAESVTIIFAGSRVEFLLDTTRFIVPVFADDYVRYEKLLRPDEDAGSLTFERKAMLDALYRAKIILGDKGKKVRFKPFQHHDGDHIEVLVEDDASGGEGSDIVFCKSEGSIAPFACECDYVIDYLKSCESETTTFLVRDSKTKICCYEIKDNDLNRDYTHLVFPMSYD